MSQSLVNPQGQFGVNIWWHIPELCVSVQKAHGLLLSNGFKEECLPAPSRKKAVSRAAYSFQDRRHRDGRRVTEKTRNNKNALVYGILARRQTGEDEMAYEQDTMVTYHKESSQVTVEGTLHDEFMGSLARYEGSITDDDIRLFLRHIVRQTKGVSKRPSGGIYFVPDCFVDKIKAAQGVLDGLGVGARLYVERVMNGEEERKIVWEAVENDIVFQVEDVLDKVGRIEKRASSVQSHEGRIRELNELMDIYKGLLGREAEYESLTEKLSEASSVVADKLAAIQSLAPPAPAKEKSKRKPVGKEVPRAVLAVLGASFGHGVHVSDIASRVKDLGVSLRTTPSQAEVSWLGSVLTAMEKKGMIERVSSGCYRSVSPAGA